MTHWINISLRELIFGGGLVTADSGLISVPFRP